MVSLARVVALALGVHIAAAATIDTSSVSIPQAVIGTLQGNLPPGHKRLIVMQGLPLFSKQIAPYICKGQPALVAHTPGLGPNGACFKGTDFETLQSNLSCTCLTFDTDAEWTFKIKNSESFVERELPVTMSDKDVLEVDSTMILGVAPSVQTLKLIGVGEQRARIQLMKSPVATIATNVVSLIVSDQDATISTVYVENVDFNIAIADGFVPAKLSNLTLKNCNISYFASSIVEKSPSLAALDLSNNNLSFAFDNTTSTTLTTLNLTSNNITEFPSNLAKLNQLASLSLKNNPIVSYTVNRTAFDSFMTQLKTFEMDPIENCSTGELQTLGSGQLCVLPAVTTPPSVAPAPTDTSSGTTTYLIIGLIAGCVVIAALVYVIVQRNSCRSDDAPDFTKEPLDAYFDNTLSYDDTHPTVSASLLNDPIIITNRIPYNDIRVANCISKGGFGLVYSGVYNRRRVAIKKIRPDRAGDIKMIEAFLKEICLMATLHHAHIVEFVGVSWDSLRNLCAVTEFMDRGDLREVLHGFKLRNVPLTWDNHKTTIALHIAEGLTYLHSLSPKVIHRDLKSKNVLLNSEMEAKLSDFGISRERHIEETHMTAGIGTSFWIAPEVLLGKDYDERADIFSFGVVLSEIDTDDYPYWNASNPNVGNKAQENMILQMVASGAMRPSFSESCPKAVLELADLCLQVDPLNRPTAAEVAYKLQQIVQFLNPPSNRSAGAAFQ